MSAPTSNGTPPHRSLKRRHFLQVAGGGTAGALILRAMGLPPLGAGSVFAHGPELTKFTEQLPIPPVLNAAGGGSFDLSMAPGVHSFHTDLPPTTTWGYGGAGYLGPTFEARRGVPFEVQAANSLGAHPLADRVDTTLHGAVEADKTSPRVSLHLHGGNTEPESDGHPDHTFLPGENRSYYYHNDQEAATLWYHDHALGITRLNVYAGLAGFYLLRDDKDTGETDNPIGLPAGPYEIPIVIQDKMFDSDGSLEYPMGMYGSIWAPEFFGDVAVVNGKVWPNLEVARGLYRFRVINGSNARVYQLKLSSSPAMYQIGTDGGLLDAPVRISQLVLAPGERADLLVDFSRVPAGRRIVLTNSAPTPFPDGPRNPRHEGAPLKEIMQFTVGAAAGFAGPVPAVLRETPIPTLTTSLPARNVTLVELLDVATGAPVEALLNNLPWHTTQLETPQVDTVEQWNIVNTTGDTHPIHLHLVQFQLLGRQKFNVPAYLEASYPLLPDPAGGEEGPHPAPSADAFVRGAMRRPDANERGWKDTVRANPGEITRILVPFGAGAAQGLAIGRSFTGEYVWHCHILEHEDNEMMLPYRVV